MSRMIVVRYSSVDGYSQRRRYSTLKGAQKWAQSCVGKTPTMGSSYAVSDDGVGKIEVSLADSFGSGHFPIDKLFPDSAEAKERAAARLGIVTLVDAAVAGGLGLDSAAAAAIKADRAAWDAADVAQYCGGPDDHRDDMEGIL